VTYMSGEYIDPIQGQYRSCTCHTSFRVSEAKRHRGGMLVCPRCGRLHKPPAVAVESDAALRRRRQRQAEAAQGRLF